MYLLIIYSILKIGSQMRTLVFMNTVNFVDKNQCKRSDTESTVEVQFVYQNERLGF